LSVDTVDFDYYYYVAKKHYKITDLTFPLIANNPTFKKTRKYFTVFAKS